MAMRRLRLWAVLLWAASLPASAAVLTDAVVAPLEARAYAADVDGDERAAVSWYEKATESQPENPDPWYDLGFYHWQVTGNLCAAYQAFKHQVMRGRRG